MNQKLNWDAQSYDDKHRFVSIYGEDLMSWLPIKPGHKILDLGCGTGHLSHLIKNLGAEVTGIDASTAMISLAKQNYPNINFKVQDATQFRVDEPLDAVFSNATLHWIHNQDGVISCVYEALKTNGKFVLEMGAKNNVLAIRNAIQQVLKDEKLPINANYWFFPSIGEYIQLLEKHNFEVSQAALFDRPTQLIGNHGMKNWIEQFAHYYFEDLSLEHKNDLIQKTIEILKPSLYHGGVWTADYKRLRIQAIKK